MANLVVGTMWSVLLASADAGGPPPQFTITDVGSLGGTSAQANDINSSMQVVGASTLTPAGGGPHAFLWDEIGGMIDLGTLGGDVSSAEAINDAGQVAGRARFSPGDSDEHAFFWDQVNGMIDLGTLGGARSQARGMNDVGQAVGDSADDRRAFLWDSANGMIDLGTLGGTGSFASDINNLGQVVGGSRNENGESRAFLWDATNGMTDLGTLGTESFARAINENGQTVGFSILEVPPGGISAFLWDAANGMVALGMLDAQAAFAQDINDSGDIVGYPASSGESDRAFLYTNGMMYDLNDLVFDGSGWELWRANAIANNGQIVG